MKNVIIVSPTFPPCNLAGAHRARLLSRHLHKFSYHPIVLTIKPEFYEQKPDYELMKLVSSDVEVIRTDAIPTKPIRIIGDYGLRCFFQTLREIKKIVKTRKISLVVFTVYPAYTMLLGPYIKKHLKIPYVIDYIDPWVQPIQHNTLKSPKALASHWLALLLEPYAARNAAGIMGISRGYYQGVIDRNPILRKRPTTDIPYGVEPLDYVQLTENIKPNILKENKFDDKIIFIYAGAILPFSFKILRMLLVALGKVRNSDFIYSKKIHFLFVGTGYHYANPNSFVVKPIAEELGVCDIITEIPERRNYTEILELLFHVKAVMIIGSTEKHYSASKTFQALMSNQHILAILHKESSAAEILEEQDNTWLEKIDEQTDFEAIVDQMVEKIKQICIKENSKRTIKNLENYTTETMTKKLAIFFDEVLSQVIKK